MMGGSLIGDIREEVSEVSMAVSPPCRSCSPSSDIRYPGSTVEGRGLYIRIVYLKVNSRIWTDHRRLNQHYFATGMYRPTCTHDIGYKFRPAYQNINSFIFNTQLNSQTCHFVIDIILFANEFVFFQDIELLSGGELFSADTACEAF